MNVTQDTHQHVLWNKFLQTIFLNEGIFTFLLLINICQIPLDMELIYIHSKVYGSNYIFVL